MIPDTATPAVGGDGIFSADDIARAQKWLDEVPQHPIIGAIRFRNALQAFIRSVGHSHSVTAPLKIMAVDTSEVVALANYDQPSYRNFTFGNLLEREDGQSRRLAALDQLINHHLLVGREEPFLLTPSHADEVAIIRQAVSHQTQVDAQTVVESNFGKISSNQRQIIRKWFDEQYGQNLEEKWREFKDQFLGDISDTFLKSLIRGTEAAKSLDAFIGTAPYVFLRPPSAGPRSLAAYVQSQYDGGFDWAAYDDYRSRPEVLGRARGMASVVRDLLLRVRRGKRSPQVIRDAAKRDAQAIALIDLLNRFFVAQKSNVRIDLVSRSPSLHALMAALPEGAVHLTLRHPLFLPDIYKFDLQQLDRLGEALLRVDATLASAIDIGSLSDETSLSLIQEVKLCALEVIDVLEGALTVRQALESRLFDDVAGDVELSKLIKDFFRQVEEGGADGRDLFSSDLLAQLAQRNKGLAEFARPWVFGQSHETVPFRLIDFFPPETELNDESVQYEKREKGKPRPPQPIDGFMPDSLMAIRADQGGFRRVFFVHSGRVARLIRRSQISDHQGGVVSPQRANVPVDIMFNQLSVALDTLIAPEGEGPCADDNAVFNLDATLLVCLGFASRGRYDTAISLASTVLHKITSELRYGPGDVLSEDRMRERLAYRELFLCRHYCERALARLDFFSEERRLADSKGSVMKNLARAQRDLDFATLMTEQVELCTGCAHPSPAGNQVVRDERLRLAHLGAWIDQLMMLLYVEAVWDDEEWPDPRIHAHRERFDIFTAAGLIKEITLIAWTVREKRAILTAGRNDVHAENLSRYYAYIEVSCFQSALFLFCLFLAYPLSPPLHRLWLGDTNLDPERILVFRDWRDWYSRYQSLDDQYRFDMRPRRLLETVCDTVLKASELPEAPKGASGRGRAKQPDSLFAILEECCERLSGIGACGTADGRGNDPFGGGDASGLVPLLAEALAERIGFIISRDPLLARRAAGRKEGADD